MSVWSSVGWGELAAVEHTDVANYEGVGDADITVDVATGPAHLIRLAAFRFGFGKKVIDQSVLLDPDTALKLADRLITAARDVKAAES